MPLTRLKTHGPVDLDRLLTRCQLGEQDAWDQLVDRFQAHVYSVPRRIGLKEDDAADVFQNTFLALYRSLDRIQSGNALPSWLALTASREALRIKRINTKTVSLADDSGRSLEETLVSEDIQADDQTQLAVESNSVRAAIHGLGGRCKELLTALYLEEDVPYSEINERFGIPIGAIGPTRARCLEKLQKILAKEGFFD